MRVNEQSQAEGSVDPAIIDLTAEGAGVDGGEVSQAEIEHLRTQVADLKNEILRGRADMDNQRKRTERELESAHKYGLERFVHDLLPVKDSLDLGLQAALAATEVEGLRAGMAMTIKMFDDFFEKLNIRQIDPTGERFDPEFHQAMTMEASTEVVPGTVTRVMQSGYVLNQRLLRPALVVVAKQVADGGA